MPQVSVLMPVYNGEPFLGQAIESILLQTFVDFEFIIINDGSTDRSAEVVQSYDDSRIRYFENEYNIGLTRSLNRGLSLVQGPYIARMDADDVSLPQRLARQVDFLDAHPNVGVVGTAMQIIDENDKTHRTWHSLTTHEALRWCLCLYDPIAHPTVLMRRQVVEQVGGYRVEMVTAQDYDLWRRLSKVTQLANLPNVLFCLRRHKTNVTTVRLAEHRQNRVKVSHEAISEFLGRDVSIDTVRCIWNRNCESLSKVRQTASLIHEIYKAGMANDALSLAEKHFVRNYVAKRLFGLAHQRTDDGRAWDAVALACRLDPLVIVKAVNRRFGHLTRRQCLFWVTTG